MNVAPSQRASEELTHMRRLAITLLCLVAALLPGSPRVGAQTAVIQSVTIAKNTFNPTAQQTTHIGAVFAEAGRATVLIVDRDGYQVRTLVAGAAVTTGPSDWLWDGRNDTGAVVPDEAYSVKIDWRSGSKRATYFPANGPATMQTIPIRYYDRRGGTLVYVLPQPSRVHVQSGSAVVDTKTNVAEGPVLKTIVNREPRAAGSIAEYWNGYDASGTIYVPDVPNFVISVAATPLPENSIITIGNKTSSFLDQAVMRKARSLFTYEVRSHVHHTGLPAAADVSPELNIRPRGVTWSARERAWIADGSAVTFSVAPSGPTAATFEREPGRIFHFVNYKLIGERKPVPGNKIVVPVSALQCGTNAISVNWRSEYGAVAANSFRVLVQTRVDCRDRTR
jgi:flagellar hook assembly protein FlgD